MKSSIKEIDLCSYCLEHNCWQCEYTIACQHFCEENVFYPAVLTDGYKSEPAHYDGSNPERMWDNVN